MIFVLLTFGQSDIHLTVQHFKISVLILTIFECFNFLFHIGQMSLIGLSSKNFHFYLFRCYM